MKQLFRMAMLGVIVGVVVLLAKFDPQAVVTSKRGQSVRSWMKANITNADAELIGFSETRTLWDRIYQVGWIRGKNAHGVTVVTNYVFEVTPDREILQGWSSREFVAGRQFELQGMAPSMQGQRAGELQRFCKEMGIPVERDA